MWWALRSKSWFPIPINVFLVEHRNGLVLFDAGLSPAVTANPNYVRSGVGRYFLHKLFRLHIGADDTLAHNLAMLGYRAADVDKVVVSHLHFDHVGGISEVPQADLLVSRDEWRQLDGRHPERDFIFREHIELPGAKWRPVDFAATADPLFAPFGGSFDLMGDGSMVLLPTPGHTAGSMSMLVQAAGWPPLLFVGDLTYEVQLLLRGQVPGTGEESVLHSSFDKVRHLRDRLPGLRILPGHDAKAAEGLAALAARSAPVAGEP